MKKAIKVITVVLLVCVMSVSMTGCIAIDNMRARQGWLTEDGNINLNGVIYKLLPECRFLSPVFDYETSNIYITTPDVPVLLSSFGELYDISTDGVIINRRYSDDGYYCREAEYDKIVKAIEEGYEAQGYEYSYYDFERGDEFDYIFTADEIAAVEKAMKGATVDEIAVNHSYYAEVYSYMNNLPLGQYEFSIWGEENDWYIEKNSDNYEVEVNEDVVEWELEYIKVPAKFNETFNKIMKKCVEENTVFSVDYYD
ncbi:MAG: hypothetical protein ACI4GZ_04305 [Ruminococcus sp.]